MLRWECGHDRAVIRIGIDDVFLVVLLLCKPHLRTHDGRRPVVLHPRHPADMPRSGSQSPAELKYNTRALKANRMKEIAKSTFCLGYNPAKRSFHASLEKRTRYWLLGWSFLLKGLAQNPKPFPFDSRRWTWKPWNLNTLWG